MADKMTAINPKMLIWAREASGTTLSEAEEKFGREKLKKWEQGLDYPTYPKLKALGEFYRKPIAVFFFPEPPTLKNIPSSCRTLPEVFYSRFDRNTVRLMDKARAMQINLYELNNYKNPTPFILAKLGFDKLDISTLATKLRKLLGADLTIQ